jgi:hypothetical protein
MSDLRCKHGSWPEMCEQCLRDDVAIWRQSTLDCSKALGEMRDDRDRLRGLLRLTYGCIGTLRRMADSPAREQYDQLQRDIDATLTGTAVQPPVNSSNSVPTTKG